MISKSDVRPTPSLLLLALIVSSVGRAEAPARTEPADGSPKGKLSVPITSVLPKYQPPRKAAHAESPETEAPADKPRNHIVRLPRYVVRERKPPEFAASELLTPKGKLDLALKRHSGLKLGPFAWLNNAIALEMLAEEQQYERRKQLEELGDFERSFDVLAHDPLRERETGAGGPDHVPVR